MTSRTGIPDLARYRVPRSAAATAVAGRTSRYLHPGQLLVATEPTAVTTILGSCVSVCLHDRRRRTGGINHFMLPNWAGKGPSSARFGNVAIESLIERMLAAGCSTHDLRATLFGGSHLLPGSGGATEDGKGFALGARNVEVARALLGAARIEIVGEDVGGRLGRKLTFFSDDGGFQVRTLQGPASRRST